MTDDSIQPYVLAEIDKDDFPDMSVPNETDTGVVFLFNTKDDDPVPVINVVGTWENAGEIAAYLYDMEDDGKYYAVIPENRVKVKSTDE